MDHVKQMYDKHCNEPGDIRDHLPMLCHLAQSCQVVCECGVRGVVSTWAFLHGFLSSHSNLNHQTTKRLYCVDIELSENITNLLDFAPQLSSHNINVHFLQHNSATVELPEAVDMLFIDTWHIYGHLKRELEFHHANVKKYIVMHDVEVDALDGEAVRCGQDIDSMATISGYPREEITKGLKPAIDEFLCAHNEWNISYFTPFCNGLMVLERMAK